MFRIKYSPCVTLKKRARIEERVKVRVFKKSLNISILEKATISNDVLIQGSGVFILGENTYVSSNSIIGVNEKITIGNNVMIASNVSIRDTSHVYSNLNVPMVTQSIETSPIYIADDVWIGHGAVINKGIKVGKGSIIGANSVVTKDVEELSIVGGIPAKKIKNRKII